MAPTLSTASSYSRLPSPPTLASPESVVRPSAKEVAIGGFRIGAASPPWPSPAAISPAVTGQSLDTDDEERASSDGPRLPNIGNVCANAAQISPRDQLWIPQASDADVSAAIAAWARAPGAAPPEQPRPFSRCAAAVGKLFNAAANCKDVPKQRQETVTADPREWVLGRPRLRAQLALSNTLDALGIVGEQASLSRWKVVNESGTWHIRPNSTHSTNEDWLPYARRSRGRLESYSTSYESSASTEVEVPRARSASPERCRMLYEDHEVRQRRWLTRFDDEERRLQAFREEVRNPCPTRRFDTQSFNEWYKERMERHDKAKQRSRSLHEEDQRQRRSEELAECSFAPRISERSCNLGQSEDHRRGQDAQMCAKVIAQDLVSTQSTCVKLLRELDSREKDLKEALHSEAADDLTHALRENERQLTRFAGTSAGRLQLEARAREYVDLNRGMSKEAAFAEACRDLLRASEQKLCAECEDALNHREQIESQRIRLERMKVAQELIRLQKSFEDLVSSRAIGRKHARGFDTGLVNQLQNEAWYLEALESALDLVNVQGEALLPNGGGGGGSDISFVRP